MRPTPNQHPLLYTALICILVYALLTAAPMVPVLPDWLTQPPSWADPKGPSPAVYAASVALGSLSLTLVGAGALWRTGVVAEVALAALFLTGWLCASALAAATDSAKLYLAPAGSVLFLLGCLFLGKLLSRIVRDRALALPVAIVAGLADIYTVFWGPTGRALQSAPAVVERLSLSIPEIGSAAGPRGVEGLAHVATMGVGDFIFLTLFMCIAVRFALNVRRTFLAMLGGAVVAIVLALADPLDLPGMPLLPYMAAGFVLANARDFRLTPHERRDFIIALGILAALAVAIWASLRL